MTTIWLLTTHMIDGLSMIPLATEADCRAAPAALPAPIASDGECTRIEVLAPASPFAPEVSPLPPRKPEEKPDA